MRFTKDLPKPSCDIPSHLSHFGTFCNMANKRNVTWPVRISDGPCERLSEKRKKNLGSWCISDEPWFKIYLVQIRRLEFTWRGGCPHGVKKDSSDDCTYFPLFYFILTKQFRKCPHKTGRIFFTNCQFRRKPFPHKSFR